MSRVFCNRDECPYSSLGGWCQLENPTWVPSEYKKMPINCHLMLNQPIEEQER